MNDTPQPPVAANGQSLRPQSLMFGFLGSCVLGQNICVFSGSIIDVFARHGVSEQATRSTLTRMVNRQLLRRQRHGRRMYFGLSPRSREILEDGKERIWKMGAVNESWDGTWTLLGFSLPESWQRQRHDLRSKLVWAGFGPVLSGLWIAPGEVDVHEIVAELGLEAHVKVFRAQAYPGTDIEEMLRDAYDLEELAAQYRAFHDEWASLASTSSPGEPADSLVLQLRLETQWLRIIRTDPRLPVQHLPEDWPAGPAQRVFHQVHDKVSGPAREMADRMLDTVPDETAS
ncbi:PaaX family transcriptional regulator [Streptomyces sp. bgisy130]|uniref:PaaX family transcriptional regulator n=1 Tax=Streptomyces sp. bgisy130 TaxID=3413788 RepID=UPI003F4A3BDC